MDTLETRVAELETLVLQSKPHEILKEVAEIESKITELLGPAASNLSKAAETAVVPLTPPHLKLAHIYSQEQQIRKLADELAQIESLSIPELSTHELDPKFKTLFEEYDDLAVRSARQLQNFISNEFKCRYEI